MDINKSENLNAIFALESLRAGVPTRNSTRELPDIRKNITVNIVRDLEEFQFGNRPMGKLVWGQYGQGKTHVLTTVEHIALDMGFAVSRVSLSREVSCHNLFDFYKKVGPRVRTPDSNVSGIQRALNQKQASDLPDSMIYEVKRYVNRLPAIVLEDYFYTSGEEQDMLYSDLMGIKIPMQDFKRIHRSSRHESLVLTENFKVNDHASAYFGVLADAIRFCGYKGWVILIDEVELLGRLGRLARLKAYMNLNWLLNWTNEMKYPIYTIAAAATRLQDDTWYGGVNDDRHKMPEVAASKFGQTAKDQIEEFFNKAVSSINPKVYPATEEGLLELLNGIASLHGKSYHWIPEFNSKELISKLGSTTVRTYIRAALETLDIQYVYKENVKLEMNEMKEEKLSEDESFFSEDAS